MRLLAAITILAALTVAPPADAQKPGVGKVTGFDIPRFVTIRSKLAHLRVGPGGEYPIRWRLKRAGMPAQIVDEEEQWREIMLHDGERGWIHAPLLSGARSLYVTAEKAPLRDEPRAEAEIVAYAQARVILSVSRCEPRWCAVRKGKLTGWIDRAHVWGVFDKETFE